MLHRLSKPHEKSVFQLYPMPHPDAIKPEKKKPTFKKEYDITTDGTYWYSDNRQYRRHRETFVIERRRGKGEWSEISDYERYNVLPKAILQDFDRVVAFNAAVSGMEKGSQDVHTS